MKIVASFELIMTIKVTSRNIIYNHNCIEDPLKSGVHFSLSKCYATTKLWHVKVLMSKGHCLENNNCRLTLQRIQYAFNNLHGSYNILKWIYIYKEFHVS